MEASNDICKKKHIFEPVLVFKKLSTKNYQIKNGKTSNFIYRTMGRP